MLYEVITYLNALLEQVAIVCHQGIMSFEDHNNLKSSNVQEIVVVESQVARTQPINLVLTPRAAYERILVGLNSVITSYSIHYTKLYEVNKVLINN